MSVASKAPESTSTPGSISAFFPAYHDWGTIASQVVLVSRVLAELTDDWEVIVVDDGSRDRTPEVLDELQKLCPRLRVVTHQQNRGYGGALRSGFDGRAQGLGLLHRRRRAVRRLRAARCCGRGARASSS